MLVRQYSRTTDGNEEFATPILGKQLTCCYIFSSVLCSESRGKAKRKVELRELMVASQSIPSMSDSNLLMSLEVEQFVVIFLLFLLPLQSCKIKWNYKSGGLFPPFFFVAFHPTWLFCFTAEELSPCTASTGSLAIQAKKKWKKLSKKQMKSGKPIGKKKGSNKVGIVAVVCVLWKYQ